jgi:tRNA (uracil-5-)-methyltransferase TRM9
MSTNVPKKLTRGLLIVAGTISTGLGIAGIFIPVLPTTPFLLLAAACYMRSSERLYRRLLNNKILGTYICNYIEGKGMALRAKAITLLLLWGSIGVTMCLGTQNLAVRIVLGLVAAGVTVHIIMLKTRKKATVPPDTENGRALKEVFDEIAPGWYNFRHRSIFTRELEELAGRWRGGRLLNVGCAHGADFIPFKESFELYGIDISGRMLELAQKYAEKNRFQVNLTQADAREIPYDDGFFDFAVAAATYHHIEGGEERLKALKELRRVLKPGGEAFITVWNKWQPGFWIKKKDVLVPWKTKNKTLYRYYYLFSYGELEELMKKAGFTVVKSFPENRYKFPIKTFSRNICVLAKKA